MYRKGKYTQKRSVVDNAKQFAKRRWQWWKKQSKKKKALIITAPILAFLIITPVATYAYFYNDIGDKDRLLNRNNTGVVLRDVNDEVFYTTPGARAERRELLTLDQISDNTEEALIASEDKNFYEHGGFSPVSIVRALYLNVANRGIESGGSTITQQLAKNTLLTTDQTILRKYQEVVIATAIEQRYSKDQILEMYLNSVYYGENAFGIDDAAQTYFGKSANDLTLAESAMLIGVLPAPSAYSPISGDPELAKERQTTVLERMVRNGYITDEQKTDALAEKLTYQEPESGIDNTAPHFTEMVLKQLYDQYGEEKVNRSGFQVKTTLDLNAQKRAQDAVDMQMPVIEASGGSNAAVVAMDPKSSEVRALVGSQDYENEEFGQINMATSPRQPGSSWKPLYYSHALDAGIITPTTVLNDTVTDFGGYTPRDADLNEASRGKVTTRTAINFSLNIPSVEVMQKVGIKEAMNQIDELGVRSYDHDADYGLPFALGAAEVPLVEMTNAYSTLANQGSHIDYSIIKSVNDKYERTIFTNEQESNSALSEQGAYLMTNILADRDAKRGAFGDALTVYGTDGQAKNVAVKTGTTNDQKDALTMGYTPNFVVGVWVGNTDNTAMASGGTALASPIFKQIMSESIGSNSPEFTQPSGVVQRTVCTDLGPKTDVFLSSNVPRECERPQQNQPQEREQQQEQPEEQAAEPCTVAGREDLDADDPNCQEELCDIPGLEDIAANDPNCVEETDSDGDGINDEADQCPGTASGAAVDANGCSDAQNTESDSTDTTDGSGTPNENSNGSGSTSQGLLDQGGFIAPPSRP